MLEMRNSLQKKINKKGFTLAELLVVVAIIAILVAVSIPIFTGKLNEASENTDKANVRAAKAAATVEYLQDATKQGVAYEGYYDAENGKIVDAAAAKSLDPYGKVDTTKDQIVKVTISADGKTVEAKFSPKPAA